MAWRSSAIRVPLVLYLLFGIAVFAKKKPPLQPVNINTATLEELQLVPGIGPSTAEQILQMHKWYGPFKSVDDLLAIAGSVRNASKKYASTSRLASHRPRERRHCHQNLRQPQNLSRQLKDNSGPE